MELEGNNNWTIPSPIIEDSQIEYQQIYTNPSKN